MMTYPMYDYIDFVIVGMIFSSLFLLLIMPNVFELIMEIAFLGLSIIFLALTLITAFNFILTLV